jgi:phosphoglycolate phosphatase
VINIIFDFDGTLFDSSDGIYEAYSLSCALTNTSRLNKPDFIAHIGPPIIHIAQKLHPELSDEKLGKFARYFRAHYDDYLYLKSYPYQDVHRLLNYLHTSNACGIIGVVTNKPTTPTLNLLSKYHLANYFDKVIGIDYLFIKQAGEPFESKSRAILYLKSLFPGSNSPYIYIGDTYSDQIAAQESNCEFISVNYGYGRSDRSSSRDMPLITVDSIAELISELMVLT